MAFADYNKILLFGDSITEQSFEQARYVFPALTSSTKRGYIGVSRVCGGGGEKYRRGIYDIASGVSTLE